MSELNLESAMNDFLKATLTAANETAKVAFKAGHDAGYREGFKDGIAAAQKIIDDAFAPKPGGSDEEPEPITREEADLAADDAGQPRFGPL